MQQSFTFAGVTDASTSQELPTPSAPRKRARSGNAASSQWHLSNNTRSTGLAGVKAAKAILASQEHSHTVAA